MSCKKIFSAFLALFAFGVATYSSTQVFASSSTSSRTPNTWNKVSPEDTSQRDGNLNKTTENGGTFIAGAEYSKQRNQSTYKSVSKISKKTGVKEDALYPLFDRGFSENEVKDLIVVNVLSGEPLNEIANTYEDSKKDLNLLLNAYQIKQAEFNNKKSEMFD